MGSLTREVAWQFAPREGIGDNPRSWGSGPERSALACCVLESAVGHQPSPAHPPHVTHSVSVWLVKMPRVSSRDMADRRDRLGFASSRQNDSAGWSELRSYGEIGRLDACRCGLRRAWCQYEAALLRSLAACGSPEHRSPCRLVGFGLPALSLPSRMDALMGKGLRECAKMPFVGDRTLSASRRLRRSPAGHLDVASARESLSSGRTPRVSVGFHQAVPRRTTGE